MTHEISSKPKALDWPPGYVCSAADQQIQERSSRRGWTNKIVDTPVLKKPLPSVALDLGQNTDFYKTVENFESQKQKLAEQQKQIEQSLPELSTEIIYYRQERRKRTRGLDDLDVALRTMVPKSKNKPIFVGVVEDDESEE